ncbi:class II 3-deoxy-7-phosphoheptulonate synthase [Brevibacterium casei]|uniref:Phospho-2-dehydro-3-deoxyheptonate aldolase n=3 Tax=Brevibacterium casei TaxID=33889 RepID=K9ATL3_9MICO|nr:3-deoxy-7-phosphoheptulonate synthase class II [Brevibacterium casei]EKU45927.1 phospho-2-dehydro-3-deoxyheptonate aldolase [Brevibacterium casei S18]NJE68125.1 3-deoxy-7-phosphoheptulonate synthase class II [Brevibacterium sp. LS14]MBE4695875.1 3-deoxy-7-phosphoheptulonate synthase class II [Brevibacterium casei]MBY3578997.1 3-deoxy-7-phosphoheptulonate synthase class II [Brevibacterium casei]MCT1447034.1 3-deoxy-7-phosphoheptulonate synthase class II [Brevibacterium casei]
MSLHIDPVFAQTDITAAGTDDLTGLDDWRSMDAKQQPTYLDAEALEDSLTKLRSLPPLIFAGEADVLKQRIAAASRGEAFVLAGGDCAESFAGAQADKIRARVQTVLQMAAVLTYGGSMPVVKIGRMAGQFAKPRSADMETRDGVTLPSFRGDIVNGYEFTEESRRHDPARLLQGYHVSSSTLNLIRAFTQGGFADLRLVHEWNRGFLASNPGYQRYEQTAREIDRAIRFMDACGADFDALRTTEFYSAHEALLLEYERALTRIDSRTGLPYDVSGHFLWIGERTREIDGAHVDFLSKVQNPIGVKLGPTATAEDALALAEKLDPNAEPGRLTFVTRMGAGKINDVLPKLLAGIGDRLPQVTWMSDPMHGNTITSSTGYKTRRFEDVMAEVEGFFSAHQEAGTIPGGLHIELTGDDVTEIMGGATEIDDEGLRRRYETLVDPRLNHDQSLEMAFQVAEYLTRRG